MGNRGRSEFISAAEHWLELFDSSFAHDNVPLSARPLQSAMLLVKDGISRISNGSKENYLEEEWFAVIVLRIREWYQDRYGAAAFRVVRDVLAGIVEFHNTPVKLEARVTVSRVEVEDESAWIIFPDAIYETETIQSFFPSKPNFNTLQPVERDKLERQVGDIVRWSRSINLSLQFASELSEEAKQMAEGVWGHVEKAVSDILSLKPAVAAVGCWELHLGVEKAFKVFLRQNANEKKGHCLDALSLESAGLGLIVSPSLLAKLPPWKQAIELRYGERGIAIPDAMENYDAALQLIYGITAKLRRELTINNGSLLLKKPRWVSKEFDNILADSIRCNE